MMQITYREARFLHSLAMEPSTSVYKRFVNHMITVGGEDQPPYSAWVMVVARAILREHRRRSTRSDSISQTAREMLANAKEYKKALDVAKRTRPTAGGPALSLRSMETGGCSGCCHCHCYFTH